MNLIALVFSTLFLKGSYCCDDFGSEDYKGVQRSPKIVITTLPGNIKFLEGNYSVLIDGVGVRVRFDCWAPYPINVKFKGHLTNRAATVGLIERKAKDPLDVSTYCFSINVTLHAYEEITGEYTCFAVNNESLRFSHYIFHAAHPPETLLNRNMTLRLVLDLEQTFTVIPCPTSNPYIPVHLFKETGGTLEEIHIDGTAIRYDPHQGFVVLTLLITTDNPVRYRCTTQLSDRDFVDITVSRPRMKVLATPSYKTIIVKEGEMVQVECQSVEPFVFDNSNPEVIGHYVSQGLTQRKEGFAHVSMYRTDALKAGDGGVISCMSRESKQTLFEWSYRAVKKQQKRHGLSQKLTLNSPECQLASGGMRIALFECANWVECNLRKCNYLDRNCYDSVKCNDAKTSSCIKNGIIQCFNPNNESAQTEIFFSGIHSRKIYTNWASAPISSLLKITVPTKNFSLGNFVTKYTEVEFICEGSAFVFAVGFKWYLVQAKENSKQIQIPDENVQHRWKSQVFKNVIRSIAKMNISEETLQIVCKAPIWNTTEWKEQIFNLSCLLQDNPSSRNSASSLRIYQIASTNFTPFTFFLIWSNLLSLKK